MKTTPILILIAASALTGCMTQRTASFPGRDYDTVFNGTVRTLCQQPDLIVYKADKVAGEIRVQGRGLMGGVPDTGISVKDVGGTPVVSLLAPPHAPFADEFIRSVTSAVPGPAPTVEPRSELELEKQKLELEREKLELEKQKLEFEKQKLQQGTTTQP